MSLQYNLILSMHCLSGYHSVLFLLQNMQLVYGEEMETEGKKQNICTFCTFQERSQNSQKDCRFDTKIISNVTKHLQAAQNKTASASLK